MIETSLLDDAAIVFTTLNSAGRESFRCAVGPSTGIYAGRTCKRFDTVVIDEAAQSVEVETSIPLSLNIGNVVLLGDPQQLPATVSLSPCPHRPRLGGRLSAVRSRSSAV